MAALLTRRRRAVAGLITAGLLAAPGVALASPDPAALAAQVARLQVQAEVATEHYDAVEARFGQAVTAHLLAQRQLEQAQATATTGDAGYAARARALYEQGGGLSLFATVLAGSDISDAASQYHDLVSILNAASIRAATGMQQVTAAAAVERRLAKLASTQTRLQVSAARAAAAVRADLENEQALLAAANARVRELAAQQAAVAAQVAALSAAAVLQSALGTSFSASRAPDQVAALAIAAARSRVGDVYVWGGTGPNVFDCSGLTQWSYAQAGFQLPRVAADQYDVGRHVTLGQLQPGDLLFWATDVSNPATIHHVAMYLGAGMMIEAPHTGALVRIVPVYLDGYIGATDPTATG